MALFSMAHLPEARSAPAFSTFTHRPWHAVALLAGALLFAAGCADEPTLPLVALEDHEAAEAPAFEALLTCAVYVSAGSMDCNPASPGTMGAGDGPRLNLIVGSQHQFVRLANDSPSVSGDVLSVDVTVQNLSLQPFATADGIAPHANGVRVFFVDEPSNGVQVTNHDGAHAFLGSEPAKYHGYSGSDLSPESDQAAEGILPPGAVSEPKTWEFTLNGAEDFVFSVLISTTVPDPNPDAWGVHFTKVAGGGRHSCGLTPDGRIYCWGWNIYGQIGDGTTEDRLTPVEVDAPQGVTFTDVAAGWGHSCAEAAGGKAFCWGNNDSGRLGDGTNDHQWTPVEVVAPEGITLSRLQPNWYHTCADGDDGHIYCWGGNSNNQLGNAAAPEISLQPVQVTMPPGVKLSGLVAGHSHTCATGDDGDYYCWGRNLYGELGNDTRGNSSMPVKVQAPEGVTLSEISPNRDVVCAKGSNGRAYCWGHNENGGIGDGTTENRPTPTPVAGTRRP